MKLELVLVVVFLSGWSLSVPRRLSHYGQQALLRQASRPEVPVDKFNFIDIELLQLTAAAEAGNVVLSPTSIKTTLSMLWEGADGRTAQEIGSALRLHGRGRDKQEQQLHQYQQNLTVPPASGSDKPASTLNVASTVFYSDRVAINPVYSDALANYNAKPQAINMSNPELAASAINKWVSAATHGHLTTLVDPDNLSQNPVMMLANAVFFQGTWQVAFDPQLTQEACFYTGETEPCHKVQMMETMGSFRSKLIHELEATLLEMPYNDGRFSMLFLLPEHKDGMQELMNNIVFANLLHVLNSDLEDSEYVVSIPKFSIEYNTDMVNTLKQLRVMDLFTPAANLSRMLKQDVSSSARIEPAVSNVFHKAKIVVNEEGAIASGATGALVVPLMGGPQPKFRADHPFLFFIRDLRTGGFLFAGRVSRPDGAPAADPATPAVPLSQMPETSTTSKRASAAMQQQNKDGINFHFPTNGQRVY